jgi:hypothetical protein
LRRGECVFSGWVAILIGMRKIVPRRYPAAMIVG